MSTATTTTDLAQERAALFQSLQKESVGIKPDADNATQQEPSVPAATKEKVEAKREERSAARSGPSAKKQEQAPDESKEPVETEEAPESEAQPKTEEPSKDPSKSSKEWNTKDAARYDRSWDKLAKEKEEFRREQIETDRQYKALQAEVKASKEKLDVYEKERPDVVHLTPEFYEQMAQKAIEQGDHESYRDHAQKAKDLRRDLESWTKRQEDEKQKFAYGREYYRKELISEYPEIKDSTSDLYKRAVEVYSKKAPIFDSMPDGEYYAAQIAKNYLEAERAAALSDENEQLKEKIKELQSKNQPSVSGQGTSKKQRGVDDMNTDEAREHLFQALSGSGA